MKSVTGEESSNDEVLDKSAANVIVVVPEEKGVQRDEEEIGANEEEGKQLIFALSNF